MLGRKSRKFTLKNKHVILGFLAIFLVFHIIGLIRDENLEKTKVESVCKVYDIRKGVKGSKSSRVINAFVEYHVDGIKYTTSYSKEIHVKIGLCYEMIYSSTNPKNIKVYFDKEVDCINYNGK